MDQLDGFRPGDTVKAAEQFTLSNAEGPGIEMPAGSIIEVTHPLGGELVASMLWVRASCESAGGLQVVDGRIPLAVLNRFWALESAAV